MDYDEPILKNVNNSKYLLNPKKRNEDLWKLYKQHIDAIWFVNELDFTNDVKAYEKLTKDEKYWLKMVLAFFASADIIVIDNLQLNFMNEIQYSECKLFYSVQCFMESIHSEVYLLLLDSLIKDDNEKEFLFNSINNTDFIESKCKWSLAYLNNEIPIQKRIIAWIVVEGIFFCSSFAAIFYLKSRNKNMDGLFLSNEFIARDESLHTMFNITLYKNYIKNKLTYDELIKIMSSGVSIECDFVCNCIPIDLIGINKNMMCDYVKYVCDYYLVELGYKKYYNTKNHFDWMNIISLQGKTNYFEKTVSEYKKSNVRNEKFSMDSEF